MSAQDQLTLANAKLNTARRLLLALQKTVPVTDPTWRKLEDIDDKIFEALEALGN